VYLNSQLIPIVNCTGCLCTLCLPSLYSTLYSTSSSTLSSVLPSYCPPHQPPSHSVHQGKSMSCTRWFIFHALDPWPPIKICLVHTIHHHNMLSAKSLLLAPQFFLPKETRAIFNHQPQQLKSFFQGRFRHAHLLARA
jgi:hypothetical protein